MLMALEGRVGIRMEFDMPNMFCLIEYSAELINRYKVQQRDGQTSFGRTFWNNYSQALVDVCEVIYYIPLGASVYDDNERRMEKAEPKFEKGIYLGVERDTREYRVGGNNGVAKSDAIKRVPFGDRWNADMVRNLVGVPWNPRCQRSDYRQAAADSGDKPPESVEVQQSDEHEEDGPRYGGLDLHFGTEEALKLELSH